MGLEDGVKVDIGDDVRDHSVARGWLRWLKVKLGGKSLAYQLRLLALVTALPLLLLAVIVFNEMVSRERENVRQALLQNARTLVGVIDNEINTHAVIGSTLALSQRLRAGDFPVFWTHARQALQFVPGAWLSVTTPDGATLFDTLHPIGTSLQKHAMPDLIARAFQTGQFQVSDLVAASAANPMAVMIIVPVIHDGAPLYALSIAVPSATFLRLLEKQFPQTFVVAVIDRKSAFIARIPEHTERVGTLAAQGWRDEIARSAQGWSENVSVDGYPIVTGYSPTERGWSVGVARRVDELTQPLNRVLWTLSIVGTLLLLSSLALAWWLSERAGRNMKALAISARVVGQGQPMVPLVPSFREARTIRASLAVASEELRRRGSELARINANLESEVASRTRELEAEMRRREQSESVLRQTQKIDALGQLTGGIAHDFNNMLTVVIGNLDTMLRRLRVLDDAQATRLIKPAEAAMKGARSAATLTQRMLAFARQQPLAPKPVDLRQLVSGMADMLTRTTGETIKIETVSGAGLWPVLADDNQLENALLNLVVNARDAMPNGGLITIETSNTFLDQAYAVQAGGVEPGQYVMLSVSDTGSGIPADKIEKVFEPFFTTKPAGQGTGLGLAMIHGFVKQSGGHIRIYSEIGQGTAVKIYLPRLNQSDSSVTRAATGKRAALRPGNGETILLVEDDDGVRSYAVEVLREAGYRIIEASDAESALRHFSNAEAIDLLFTDVVLGGTMNGRQLADAVAKLRPELPVVFTTGYTRNAIVHHGRLDAGVTLLSKPYASADLLEIISASIDRA